METNLDPITDQSTLNQHVSNNNTNNLDHQHNHSESIDFKNKFYSTLKNNIWIIPLIGSLLIPIGCFGPYIVSSQNGQVEPIWPFVSDAGGMLPAASYFSQFLDTAALLIGISIWVRYKQIKYLLNLLDKSNMAGDQEKSSTPSDLKERMQKKNFITLICGLLATFGSTIIGNFRSPENLTGHLVGVFFLFNFLIVYMINMVIICDQLNKNGQLESRPLSMLINVIVYLISFVGCTTFASLVSLSNGSLTIYWDNQIRIHYTNNMPGYVYHCIGTGFEWIAILSISPFVFMLSRRMRLFQHWNNVRFSL